MIRNYLLKSRTCERYYQSKAGPHLDEYVAWLSAQGYRHQTVRRYIRGVVEFAQWAESNGFDLEDMDIVALNDFGQFLEKHGQLRGSSGKYKGCFLGARKFMHFLYDKSISHALIHDDTRGCYPELYCEFTAWMLTHRGVKESTLDGYRAIILDMLKRMGGQPEQYTAKELREFVLYRVKHHNKSSAQNVISAMRMFMRYLSTAGLVDPTLEQSIPNIAAWRLQSLPRCLPASIIEDVISGCDTNTLLGARNQPIFLLLAHLGLRAGEVAGLTFDDIDWCNATLTIHDKCRRQSKLPMPQVVGDALLHYLESYRPQVGIDQVFLSTLGPHRALRRVSISQMATQALRQAGVVSPRLGAHMFRHSIATTLLNEGLSLQTIATVLRHSSLESTRLYAKVDQALLQEVAVPWPEVTSC